MILFRLGIWVASALGLYSIATNDDNGDDGFIGPILEPNPEPIEEGGNLIDFDMPFVDVDVSKWMLAIPLLWITFKYKPWK